MSDLDSDFLTFGRPSEEDDDKDHVEEKPSEALKANSNNGHANGHDNDNDNGNSRKRSRYAERVPPSLTAVSELPPWMDRPHSHKFHRNVPNLVLLHDEIVNFAAVMEPQPEELKLRQELVDNVTKLVNDTFAGRECKVSVFGSQATGLLLPTSDIDFIVHLPEQETKETPDDATKKEGEDGNDSKKNKKAKKKAKKENKTNITITKKEQEQKEMEEYSIHEEVKRSPLAQLGEALRNHPEWKDELTYLEVVEGTRVPIVKFTVNSGLSADICFNQEAGVMSADLMKRFLDAMPPLKPLTFVLKYFMAARGLNEPYSGGCGSFMLQMMIVSFLQHRERHAYNSRQNSRQNRTANTMNLGAMLLEFFELYGMDFNYLTTGISVRSDGFYFPKGAKGKKEYFHQPTRPFSLSIENPFDITSDVGKASFRMQLIAKSFEVAMRVLLSHTAEPFVPTESILASILPPTEEMHKRSTMFKVLKIEARLNTHRNKGNNGNNGNGNNDSDSRKKKKRVTEESESSSSSEEDGMTAGRNNGNKDSRQNKKRVREEADSSSSSEEDGMMPC